MENPIAEHHNTRFRLGLIINPLAGVGGRAALKGSDGVAEQALAMGVEPQAHSRVRQALESLLPLRDRIRLLAAPGVMGADLLTDMGFDCEVVGALSCPPETSAEDTETIARQMSELGVDLLLFAGGDGTARNICNQLDGRQLVLGIPAGVKIHSGVYAVNPRAAGELVALLVQGELVRLREADVRDIDEQAFRNGQVRTRHYGELSVPEEGRFVQQVKQGGREVETLVLDDIAAGLQEAQEDGTGWILGPGSTTLGLLEAMGLEGTLLGVDVLRDGEVILRDATEQQLWELVEQGGDWRILVTAIGGQGHILGRGNQQLSPRIIRAVGLDNLLVVATKTKLRSLAGRPFLVDTGDSSLDSELSGLRRVLSGYREEMLYPVNWKAE
ncbi:MAG: ATP-NAD kinase [Pseudomonadales bacterium]|jgi:predicted polyphosphate/ATP-dependent NAD kinase|uniref:ATP-NAD kinase family protein n=1 Tax=Halopseudomonas TaxID=2901189 RepID=UPI000C58B829|nr:ATP-NAD kinase family protein [Halopseudomonas aestusnigri]MAD27667.1 ATP-NAD kinase [Pseudomonadales bacterium]MEE2799806.1 ATP-NAD kinase family protein [Pseudomonadota bacterium]HBT56829.1 ATP-NAD kinase [Pseudomonas sp.]MAK73122.1 ATP-NAD kinase [Pseudomonadales bacterium]MAP75610.1 ATP-NAD kinase [Pseudomonadales bacterium]|tara:strand:- start:4233 stop:5390 length:1158 start_codon:yes stop_codon:yes gene_type:complete